MIEQEFLQRSSLVTARTHARLLRKLNRQWATRQRFQRLPTHFESIPETHPGSGGYRYRRRSSAYNRQKQRKYGHTKPNVYTGELRRAVLQNARITATQHKASVLTRGTPTHRLQDWQRREIEAVSRRERREDLKRMEKDYARLIQRPEYQAQRRRKT